MPPLLLSVQRAVRADSMAWSGRPSRAPAQVWEPWRARPTGGRRRRRRPCGGRPSGPWRARRTASRVATTRSQPIGLVTGFPRDRARARRRRRRPRWAAGRPRRRGRQPAGGRC